MAEGLEYVCFRVAAREDFAANFAAKDLGVGLLLAMYCGEKCNGGRINGAKKWTKNEWLLRVHVAEKLSRSCEGLWRWEGEDLVVECYDEVLEKRMVAKREAQRAKARKRWSVDAAGDAMGDAAGDATACAAGDAAVLLYKGKGKGNNNVVEVKGSSTAGGAGGGEPATTTTNDDEVFGRWLRRLCGAHPTLRGCGVLAPDVAEAARAAFERCPQLEEAAELIGAYMADRLQEDRYRHRFWRPLGQARFFEKLEDVAAHARAWDREVGWTAKRRRHAEAVERRRKAKPEGESSEGERPATEEETREFLEELRSMARDGKEGVEG